MVTPLALSTPVVVALVAGAIVAAAFAGALVAIRLRSRPERGPDIPPGMKPGPADEVLERRQLEKVMGWGIVFTLFFATWMPIYWFREPDTNVSDETELIQRSVERGEQWFAVPGGEHPTGFGCARCHGAEAQGGEVPFTTPEGEQVMYPVPPLNDVCGGAKYGHPLINSLDDIRATIEQGREGTPMPSWSVRYQGPMNDQQITDLILYIDSIQEGVAPEDNLCRQASAGTDTASEEPGEGGQEEEGTSTGGGES